MQSLASRPVTVVVIEDQDELNELLVTTITSEGYLTSGARSVEAYENQQNKQTPDIFVLDLNLPGEDGISFADRIRAMQPDIGIIMLTARSELEQRAQGYVHGADIYLTKPSTKDELLGALNALSRRIRPVANPGGNDEMTLCVRRLSLTGPKATVNLSSEEADFLAMAASSPGGRTRFDEIRAVLNRGEDLTKAALEIKIVRLRKKIADAGIEGRSIASVRNLGYQLLIKCAMVGE